MGKKVSISEPERLLRFMNSFHENHSDDFKALVLHLKSQSYIESVSLQTSVPVSTLYDWQSDWNKKKSQAYKTSEYKVVDQNHA
jgi:hypothetical protein